MVCQLLIDGLRLTRRHGERLVAVIFELGILLPLPSFWDFKKLCTSRFMRTAIFDYQTMSKTVTIHLDDEQYHTILLLGVTELANIEFFIRLIMKQWK